MSAKIITHKCPGISIPSTPKLEITQISINQSIMYAHKGVMHRNKN
jgi:hypothetical protein